MDLTQLPELPEFIRRKAEQAIEDATTLQGMRTNGPAYARIEASHLAALLRYAQAPRAALPDAPCRLTEEANRIAALPEAETVNTMLWLYRRIPKAYGRLPFVEKEIRSLAAKLGMNVEALLAERAALPEEKQ